MSLLFLGCLLSLKGQVKPQTAFYWENPYYISPASINLDYQNFFTLSARKQWISAKGSPTTYFATGTSYWQEYHSQLGVKILKDEIGYYNTLDFSLSYAYSLQIGWNSFLNMGIGGAYQSQEVDRNKVTLDDPDDPIWNSKRMDGLSEWNINLGAEFLYDKYLRIGIASQNLLSFLKDEPYIFGGTNYVYVRYRTRSFAQSYNSRMYGTGAFNTSYDLEYGLCIKQDENDIQFDGMISLYFNRAHQEEKFQLSLVGRSTGEIGVMGGVKLMSDLKILCCYDYNFKEMKQNSHGTFEVILSLPLRPNSICRSEWDLFK